MQDPEISIPFFFRPENGKLAGFNRSGFNRVLLGLNPNTYYYLTINEWSPMRVSDEARGYYWAVVVVWWAWFWDSGRITKSEMHEILKDHSGIESTADGEISEKNFILYIERCCELFTKVSGGVIPPPERYRYTNVFASLEGFSATNNGIKYTGDRKPRAFSLEGQAWISQVIRMKERDGKRCCVCGSRSNLTPHHIQSKGGLEGGGDELDNLMTLCIECHSKHHDHKFDEHEYLLYLNTIRRIKRSSRAYD